MALRSPIQHSFVGLHYPLVRNTEVARKRISFQKINRKKQSIKMSNFHRDKSDSAGGPEPPFGPLGPIINTIKLGNHPVSHHVTFEPAANLKASTVFCRL